MSLGCVSEPILLVSTTRESTLVAFPVPIPLRVCSESLQWASALGLADHLQDGFVLLPVKSESTAGAEVTSSSALTDTRQNTLSHLGHE